MIFNRHLPLGIIYIIINFFLIFNIYSILTVSVSLLRLLLLLLLRLRYCYCYHLNFATNKIYFIRYSIYSIYACIHSNCKYDSDERIPLCRKLATEIDFGLKYSRVS